MVTASGLRFLNRHGEPRWTAKPLFVLSRMGKRALERDIAGLRALWRGVGDWRKNRPMAIREER